jgi:hypothetical protein
MGRRSAGRPLVTAGVVALALIAIPAASAAPRGGCGPAWEIVSSPSPGDAGNSLSGVSALSATDAWAAGSYLRRTPEFVTKPLILHWDGLAWTQVPSAAPDNTFLTDVFAVSSDDAWVVAWPQYAEHWDGAAWSAVPIPDPGGVTSPTLRAVSGTSASDVWAVGWWEPALERLRPLIQHWDGTEWEIVPAPSRGPLSFLNDVVALSPTDAWAVGESTDQAFAQTRSLVMHWDGVSWTVVQSRNVRDANTSLTSVTAASGEPRAAGYAVTVNGQRARPVVLHWDGAAWMPEPTPYLGHGQNRLHGITDTTSGMAWAVGEADLSELETENLIHHWDGVEWTIQDAPNAEGQGNGLFAAMVSPDGDVWAVGSYRRDNGLSQTLILHLCP